MALDRGRLLKPVKKLRKLISRIDRNLAPGQVHALRTNTRRFEAVFGALSLNEHGIDRTILKNLGHLRKRAGKVRDLDVLTGFASTVHLPGEEECGIQLLGGLGARRKKQARKLAAEANDVRPSLRKQLKRTAAVLTRLLQEDEDQANGNQAAAEAAANAVRLAARLGVPQRLDRGNLHPYRIQIRELQNVLRIASASSDAHFLDDLGDVKDAIGEWHDWEELVSIAQRVLDHKDGCELQTELKRISKLKYENALALAQKLRKTYLQEKRASRKGAASAVRQIPRPPVWEATTSLLAG